MLLCRTTKLPEIIMPVGPAAEAHFARNPSIPEHHGADGRPIGVEQQEELRSHYRYLARMGSASKFAPSYFVLALNDHTVRLSSECALAAYFRKRGTR
jgi:hypothetical protein